MANMMKMMKQAQAMQQKAMKLQEDLAEREYSFSTGGGMVTAVVKGDMSVKAVTIQPDVVDPEDVDMLQDLIISAINGAMSNARDDSQAEMAKITGGLGLPGL
jgi:DNA-binding YbaB/EbfC family protein